MKKPNAKRRPVTPKKSRAAQQKARIKRNQAMKKLMNANTPTELDSREYLIKLEGVERTCRNMLETSLSVAGLLRNREAIARLENVNEVVEMANVFVKDIERYKDDLQMIADSRTTLNPDNPDALLESIVVAQGYQEWLESYQAVVIPTQLDIHNAFTRGIERDVPTAVTESGEVVEVEEVHETPQTL